MANGNIVASHKVYKERLFAKAIPCDDDRFIFISGWDAEGRTGSDQTPFARMSLNRDAKRVAQITPIDHGQDELRQSGVSVTGSVSQSADNNIIMTDRYATLLNFKTGLYWVFSLETASLRKAGGIFSKVTPEMVAKGGFTDAVLCAHPEKDGSILISATQEEAFTTQLDYVAEMKEVWDNNRVGQAGATMTANEWFELYQNRQRQARERQPWIVWYRIYPESGRSEKIVPPEGAAIERDSGPNDVWRPMPDGSVKMGPVIMKQPSTAPKEGLEQKAEMPL